MTCPALIHGSFTIERTFASEPERVFAAWADSDLKARWFSGPADRWQVLRREHDLRVGGAEVLHGRHLADGRESLFSARYHVIVPNEQLVYVYDMHYGGRLLSVSLASVELVRTKSGGTAMTYTEHATYFGGEDGSESRRGGTNALFDQLGVAVADPREVVSSRLLRARVAEVYDAFRDPARLASWWGPKGFTSAFEVFELRAGGAWRLTMTGPDGSVHALAKEIVEVVPSRRIVLRQPYPAEHAFTMTMTFVEVGDDTLLTWRMAFDEQGEAEKLRAVLSAANEENFDRLAAHLAERR